MAHQHHRFDLESGAENGSVLQRTLAKSVECTGTGLHSGLKITMRLVPAEPDTGIRFVRSDLPGSAPIPARWDRVVDTRMCTALANESGVAVGTVEHLMSALAGLAIDNLVVEVDGPEVPIMDGSAGPFVFLMECAGAREQPRPRRAIRVLAPVTVAGDKWRASLVPADGFSVSMDIAFDTPAVAAQSFGVRLVNGTFKKELASARTFGFLRDVQKLWAAGLARGGSLENAVVVHDDRILNEEGLRYKDEFVRHKILDAVGDLYLAGAPLLASFRGVCSGHSANNRLLQALFAREDAWTWDVMRVRQGPPAEEAVLDADVDRPAPLRAAAG